MLRGILAAQHRSLLPILRSSGEQHFLMNNEASIELTW
jgi:hypothetical protein